MGTTRVADAQTRLSSILSELHDLTQRGYEGTKRHQQLTAECEQLQSATLFWGSPKPATPRRVP